MIKLVFCLIEFDLCRFELIGCLFVCCFKEWFNCESVIMGIFNFLVNVLSEWEILVIFSVWLLVNAGICISCK